ncbi:MAG: roadblock/LC7 domain-containing protein, partial [Frankia sp.]
DFLNRFATEIREIRVVIAVSTDGLLIAQSDGFSKSECDVLAALTSNLTGIGQAAASRYDAGGLRQAIIEMERGLLLVTSIGEGAILAVLTTNRADVAHVGYELARLALRAEDALSPALRTASA